MTSAADNKNNKKISLFGASVLVCGNIVGFSRDIKISLNIDDSKVIFVSFHNNFGGNLHQPKMVS